MSHFLHTKYWDKRVSDNIKGFGKGFLTIPKVIGCTGKVVCSVTYVKGPLSRKEPTLNFTTSLEPSPHSRTSTVSPEGPWVLSGHGD